MKSVGEVMGIGRSFAEAVQKACQSLENEVVGLGYYGKSLMHTEGLLEYIKTPKWDCIFRIKDALMAGASVKRICESTKIDRWFIYQIQKICDCEKELAKYELNTLPDALLREAKPFGFSDKQIANIMLRRKMRKPSMKKKSDGADPCVRRWWIPAALSSKPRRLTSTRPLKANRLTKINFRATKALFPIKKIIVLGSGPNAYRPGHRIRLLLRAWFAGDQRIRLRSHHDQLQPETVSTDFDIADKLYFEPVFGNTSGRSSNTKTLWRHCAARRANGAQTGQAPE